MSSAVFSDDRIYRYTLEREFGGGPRLMVIGLNPSTADEVQDDPTIRRCIGFARRWEMGQLVMTNIFAFRSTYPSRLYSDTADPIGQDNDEYLFEEAQKADMIVAAWGAHGVLGGRDEYVRWLLGEFTLMCLGRTLNGQPKHPLYLNAATEPEWYSGPRPDDDASFSLAGTLEEVAA